MPARTPTWFGGGGSERALQAAAQLPRKRPSTCCMPRNGWLPHTSGPQMPAAEHPPAPCPHAPNGVHNECPDAMHLRQGHISCGAVGHKQFGENWPAASCPLQAVRELTSPIVCR